LVSATAGDKALTGQVRVRIHTYYM